MMHLHVSFSICCLTETTRLVMPTEHSQMVNAYLWTAVLPGLDVISELLVRPTGIAKVNNFVSSTQQPSLSILLADAGGTMSICGRATKNHLHKSSKTNVKLHAVKHMTQQDCRRSNRPARFVQASLATMVLKEAHESCTASLAAPCSSVDHGL